MRCKSAFCLVSLRLPVALLEIESSKSSFPLQFDPRKDRKNRPPNLPPASLPSAQPCTVASRVGSGT